MSLKRETKFSNNYLHLNKGIFSKFMSKLLFSQDLMYLDYIERRVHYKKQYTITYVTIGFDKY